MKTLLRVSMFLLFAMARAMAAEPEYQTPDEFIKGLSRAESGAQVVAGDLDGDGLADRAIVAGGQKPKLYVLLQTRSGGFRLAAASRAGALYSGEQVEIRIDKGSLYVQVDRDFIGMSGSFGGRYQFKLYKGVWRMIGLSHYSFAQDYAPASDEGPTFHGHDTDINLLTGNLIVTRTFTDAQGEKHPETTRYLAKGRPCLIADFDFDYSNCLKDWKIGDGRTVSGLMTD